MNENDDNQERTVGRPFVSGDARINRAGAPGFAKFRKIAQMISEEIVTGANGNPISRAEGMLRRWERSKDPRLQALFAAYAFGPPPQKLETNTLEHGTRLILHYAHELNDDGSFADDGPFPNLPPNGVRAEQRRLEGREAPRDISEKP
jgi:hypothetical protein